MGANPFDQPLSSKQSEEGTNKPSLQQAQNRILNLVQNCEVQRQIHRQSWEDHKREHHARRLEQALEREESEGRFIPSVVQRQLDAEDDQRYAYLKNFDELLELRTHEEYLRARRAWERRHKVEDVELNVEVRPEFRLQDLSPRQIWAALVGFFVGGVFLAGVSVSGPVALLFSPLALLAWAVITRLPLVYVGTFSSGGTRGASGNAI